jgi:hypothetical protein
MRKSTLPRRDVPGDNQQHPTTGEQRHLRSLVDTPFIEAPEMPSPATGTFVSPAKKESEHTPMTPGIIALVPLLLAGLGILTWRRSATCWQEAHKSYVSPGARGAAIFFFVMATILMLAAISFAAIWFQKP